MPEDRERLFDIVRENAFFRERIILSSGKESGYYFDARRVTLASEGVYLCARLMLDMIQDESYYAIGGPTLGADPILGAVNVLSHQSGNPMRTFIVRKTPKAYGKRQQIEGPPIARGSRVILIDDVATTGKALLQSVDVLRENGILAGKAVCIVDRGEGAKDALKQQGCELLSIFTAAEFL